MKREETVSFLIAGALAFAMAFGGLGCLATGFGLVANPALLISVCALAALVSAFLAGRKHGGVGLLCLLALVCGLYCCTRAAREQTLRLVLHISQFYYRAYGWDWLCLGEASAGSVTYPLGLTGILVAALMGWKLVRREGVCYPVLAALLPLFACLVVTDTVPGAGYLYLVLLSTLLAVYTSCLRQDSREQGNSLALLAVIPMALALGILFWAVPKESYVNKVEVFYDKILTWVSQYPGWMENASGSNGGEEPVRVDLRDTGPLLQRQYPVMDVSAPISGTMYLRGQDYDVYTGTGWTATPDRAEFLSGDPEWMENRGTVTVATLREQELRYVPYYVTGGAKLMGGAVINPRGTTAYGYAQKTLPENWRELVAAGTASMEYLSSTWTPSGMDSRYRALPEDTRVWAEGILPTILPEGLTAATDKAERIAAYVRESAEYDTNTPKMPRNHRDFVRWFLTESDTGYCVHFASATAVLLRAAGIPARYVTGYMFQAEAGTPVTVRAYQAHAWVEYYEERLGMWLVLESTPAMPEAPGVVNPTQTRPAESQETTGTTLPELPEATQPQGSIPGHTGTESVEPDAQTHRKLPEWLKTLGNLVLWTGVLLAAVITQRQLRLRLRRKKAGRGSNNRRALARWQELELLYRRLGKTPPEELKALAQKAKFSQHRLTAQELQTLNAGIRTARSLCLEKPWYQRLVDQYIYAAY